MRRLFLCGLFACVLVSTLAHAQLNSAFQCKNVPQIANGHVSKAASGGQYQLVCNPGYMVSGNGSATCTVTAAGERWSPALGTCLGTCQAPSIANGSVVYPSGQPATGYIMSNTNVSLKCNPGYTLAGYSNNHCGMSPSGAIAWSLPFGSCSGSCQLGAIQNAQILDNSGKPVTGSIAPGTAFSVRCNPGFVPPPGAVTRGTCGTDGKLSTLPASCVQTVAVNCPPTLQIQQADFAVTSGGRLNYSPADWKLSAGAATALTLPLTSVNVDNGQVLNCGYTSPSGMASLTKRVSEFGTRCQAGSNGRSFVCYK